MRANEFITERFDYSSYVPMLKRLIKDTFYQVASDTDIPDPMGKVNEFFYQLQEQIDEQILVKLLKDNPIVINQTPIRSLTISFEPEFEGPIGRVNMGSLSATVQRRLKSVYPGADVGKAGKETNAKYIRSHVDFTGEADFGFSSEAKSAMVRVGIHGSEVANYVFQAEDTAIATAALDTLATSIMGKVFHEIKHFIQNTKVTKNLGYNAQVNKFYTGDPAKLTAKKKNQMYTNTKSGYWLNADEMDAWAANVAAEIHNVFGKDTQGITDYMNLASQGQTLNYHGVPVNTSLNHYRNEIFNPRYKLNVDRNVLWKKFIKDVYKDLQMYN